jgi:hypothetical protein
MTASSPASAAECRRLLDQALAAGARIPDDELRVLGEAPPPALDEALRGFADERLAEALPVLGALASERAQRPLRRAAKRALFRLGQRGITAPTPPSRPVVMRQPERATRAWVSAIDGSGARAVWIVFEGGYGGMSLCSLILRDTAGIVEVAGGEISKRRLETELGRLRAEQKLPWVETAPERAVGLVAEALALHRAQATTPPADFTRWERFFSSAPAVEPPVPPAEPDPSLVDRSAALLELPELGSWFIDPEAVQSDALDLLQARESRLVVSDQIKAEREEAIVRGALEREIGPEARTRWARRLLETALLFDAIDRAEHAEMARAAAGALAALDRDVLHHPFARALVHRSLDVAGEVALGRVSASEVSQKPGRSTAPRG